MQKWTRKQTKHVILTAVLVFLFSVLANAWDIWTYGAQDERKVVDVVVVLGAGVVGTKPSPVFRERISHGIWLYQNGYADKLLLTGGYGNGAAVSEAEAAREYALGQGIPKEDILIEENSRITQENIYYARLLMEENGLKDALIVSDPLHMRRAMRMAADQGIEAYSSPTPTTRFVSLRTKIPFLARELFFYTGYNLCRIFW